MQKNIAQHAANDCAIETFHLTKYFGAFTAVDRMDLVVPCGGIFDLLGPNDAGKSALIKMPAKLSEGMARVVAAARFYPRR